VSDIVAYLESKGVHLKVANESNVHTACWWHGEDASDRGRLYINIDESSAACGAFMCHVCSETGGFNKIRKHFGDPPLKTSNPSAKEDDLPDDTFLGILNSAAKYYYDCLSDAPEAYRYLREKRGFTYETIEKYRLGWAPADGGLVTHLVSQGFEVEDIKRTGLVNKWGDDFFRDKITIPYMLMGQVVQIRGKDMSGKYLTPPGQQARLFNSDAAINDDSIVLTEGEFDCIVLESLGFSAMGLPGVSTWQDSWTKQLSEAKRIYICFDNDSAGRAGAEKLASKIGPRSRIVEIPDENNGRKIDISDWFVDYGKNQDDFNYLFRKAVGGLLVSVSEAYERWTEIEGNPNLVGLRWNVREIDSQMRHGMLPGQVVTLIAKTNSGKTLISLNLFHRMAMLKPDIKILFVSLEQTRNEWFERARRIYSFYDPWASNEDTIKYWSDKFYLVDKNKITEDDLEACIEQYEYETGSLPDFVCIDYLGYYARGFAGDEYDRTTSAIMGLKGIAKRKQIVIYAPHQVNRTGSFGKELSADMAKSSGAIEETSDMMMAIWKPDQQPGRSLDDQSGEIHMKILKSRDGATGAEIVYQFAPKTLAIIPNSDPDVSRVMRERNYARNSHSWEQVMYRYRTGDEDQMFPSEENVRRVLNSPRPT
jgi:archaellum biogenesis ATPase FlaH